MKRIAARTAFAVDRLDRDRVRVGRGPGTNCMNWHTVPTQAFQDALLRADARDPRGVAVLVESVNLNAIWPDKYDPPRSLAVVAEQHGITASWASHLRLRAWHRVWFALIDLGVLR